MQTDERIQHIIDTFEPAWLPPEGELKGVVVAIDPAGGGASNAQQRVRDDLALWTGGHLYHLVLHAGGTPIMTRPDDRPAPGLHNASPEQVQAWAAQHGAHLVVSIDFAHRENRSNASKSPGAGSNQLATSLGSLFACAGYITAEAGQEPNLPAVRVNLSLPPESLAVTTRPPLHRSLAEKLYRGLARFVAESENEVRAARAARGTDANPRSMPYFPDRTWDEEVAQAARRVWPEGTLPIEKAAWFCSLWTRATLSDRSGIWLEPNVRVEDDRVIVGGATNLTTLRDSLPLALNAVGIENVSNEIRLLPEDGRTDGHRFGVCIAATALTYSDPTETAWMQTQLLYGEPLLLLDRDAGFYLIRGADGYCGWVREDCVKAIPPDEFERDTPARRAVLRTDITTPERRLPRGVTLPITKLDADSVTLRQPVGENIRVALSDVRLDDAGETAQQRVMRALDLLHRPYVFGGLSPLGLDCSGLVRQACAQTGVMMARDASQQFLHGRLVATRWWNTGIRAGDLLYFANKCGRVYHVGVAISDTHFVHAAPPEVKINSLRPGDRLYSEYRARSFMAARRLP